VRDILLALGVVADALLLERVGLVLLALGEPLVGLGRLGGVIALVDLVGERWVRGPLSVLGGPVMFGSPGTVLPDPGDPGA
jgi:hypothetical protein